MSSAMARVHAGRHLLTIEQVAARLSFSTHTIRKWFKQRQYGFPQPVKIGQRREWRWRETPPTRMTEGTGRQLRDQKPCAMMKSRNGPAPRSCADGGRKTVSRHAGGRRP